MAVKKRGFPIGSDGRLRRASDDVDRDVTRRVKIIVRADALEKIIVNGVARRYPASGILRRK